ncbi:alpha/beta hydrolase [Streptomyces sp. SL13]|uniref:Alpha/beta hydrolase n=1 Tax=Streptantibioticus silvisoli TaxID=2705255 RepID=A0AA90HEE6_9ACTN|nr:alpha/beta hydrolase [Streptantibioticus silvisoli]MDI5974165.1 alpha/beta hydrolase [Streptantibioticus silvisoli]
MMNDPMSTSTSRTVDLTDGLSITVDEYGDTSEGTAVLLLHGGAGPHSMTAFATALSEHVYVIAATHPGFDGTERPQWCDSAADLATAYLDLLDALDLSGVMVIGNSFGGWVAAEMALRDTHGRIGALILLNALGVEADRRDELVDTRGLPVAELGRLAFHDPATRLSPAALDDRQRATMAANGRATVIYGGEAFTHDPKLRDRLHRVAVPVLVAWGEQDGIATVEYGRAYAASFPNGHFVPVPDAGHFPHIEQLGRTLGAIGDFVDTVVKPTVTAPAVTSTSRTVDLAGGLTVTIAEYGDTTESSAVLVLHGGAGPRSMAGLATALSEHVYVIAATHPGFDGTERPQWCDSAADLATAYLDLLDTLDLSGVMVIGNSFGGWVAAEMALRDTRGRIGAFTLLNALGVEPGDEKQITDPRTVPPAQIGELSFVNPAFRPDFSSFSDEQRAAVGANQKALATYGGEAFTHDPKLRHHLHRVTVPVLVAWGEQDGIATVEYGRAYAASFPNGHFVPVPDAGHFPHIEQLGKTLGAIGDFVDTVVKPTVTM